MFSKDDFTKRQAKTRLAPKTFAMSEEDFEKHVKTLLSAAGREEKAAKGMRSSMRWSDTLLPTTIIYQDSERKITALVSLTIYEHLFSISS